MTVGELGELGRTHVEALVRAIRRMVLQQTITRHDNRYMYLFRTAVKAGNCTSSYCNLDRVDDLVTEHYKTIAFTPEFIDAMQSALDQLLAEDTAAQRLFRKQLHDQLKELDVKETNLIALAEDGALPRAKVRTRMTEIEREREQLTTQLDQVKDDLAAGIAFLSTCLQLLRNPYELYRNASDKVRRRLNQAIFKRIYVFNEEITGHELQQPLAELHAIQAGNITLKRGQGPEMAAGVAEERTEATCARNRTASSYRPGQRFFFWPGL